MFLSERCTEKESVESIAPGAVQMEPQTSLYNQLKLYTDDKEMLGILEDLFTITPAIREGYTKIYSEPTYEDVLIKLRASKVTREDYISDTLLRCSREAYAFFKKGAIVPEFPCDAPKDFPYHYLAACDLLTLYYHDGKYCFVVPTEIRDAYEKIDADRFENRWQVNRIRRCAIAAVALHSAANSDAMRKVIQYMNKNTAIAEINADSIKEYERLFRDVKYLYNGQAYKLDDDIFRKVDAERNYMGNSRTTVGHTASIGELEVYGNALLAASNQRLEKILAQNGKREKVSKPDSEAVIASNKALKERIASALPSLDERRKREFLAKEAKAFGRGGISLASRLSGVSRQTIAKGIKELDAGDEAGAAASGVRKQGGGRRSRVSERPELNDIVRVLVKGNPKMSLRALQRIIKANGFKVSFRVVGNIKKELGLT